MREAKNKQIEKKKSRAEDSNRVERNGQTSTSDVYMTRDKLITTGDYKMGQDKLGNSSGLIRKTAEE